MTILSCDNAYFRNRSVGVIECDTDWWMRVSADSGIAKYYSWLARGYGIPLMTFSGTFTHITVVRGEEPKNKGAWASCHGREVEFYYSHGCRWTDYHLWVDVWSEDLMKIREELGLPKKLQKTLSDGRVLEHSFHLTIGRRS